MRKLDGQKAMAWHVAPHSHRGNVHLERADQAYIAKAKDRRLQLGMGLQKNIDWMQIRQETVIDKAKGSQLRGSWAGMAIQNVTD